MTHSNRETSQRSVGSSTWWTSRRTKAASLCGLVGGLGGLGVASPLTDTAGLGIELGAVSALYPVWHALLAVALLAANARYGPSYGRDGRTVALLLALSLGSYATLTLVLMTVRIVPGDLLLPSGVLAGTTYMAIRLFGTLYGVVLWRRGGQKRASHLTAALFVVLLPAVFVLGPLTRVGFPGELIGAPLFLAFIALSYDLWTVGGDAAANGTRGGDS